jgi:hypothetical protein
MKFVKSIFAAAFMMASTTATAACGGGLCTDVYIEKLYIDVDTGTVNIATSGDETKLSCTAPGGIYATLHGAAKGTDRIYSTLLAAQLANKKVESIRVHDNSSNCSVAYVVLSRQ